MRRAYILYKKEKWRVPLIKVPTHVVLKSATPSEAAPTDLADKGLMIEMKSLVHDHITSLCEALLT